MGKISRLVNERKVKTQLHGAKRKQSKPAPSSDWKPTTIPPDFTLVIDTREQLPLFSKDRYTTRADCTYIPIIHRDVEIGDYTVLGFENMIAIERKMQSDFESYISSEYQSKTIVKLESLSNCWFSGLVIEANEYDLCEFPISPKMTREKTRNHLASINSHYGIHTYINSDRGQIERWVLDRLVRVYNYLRNGDIERPKTLEEVMGEK